MKKTAFVIVVILATFMAFGLVSTALASSGPKAANLVIHVYNNPDTENIDLQNGVLDVNDWPLTKTWIDSWATMPTTITLDAYTELGMYEVDINNQAWPTGDPTNKFYKPEIVTNHQALANESVAFRQAVACLTDRDAVITQVLKGYGNRLDVPIPPIQSNYIGTWYSSNTTFTDGQSVIYDFNVTRAVALLNAYNFTLAVGHTWRTDPRTGNDLAPLKFYIRQDDPTRLQAGELLVTQLKAAGIPVDAKITEKTVCYKEVMVLYDYALYTGGWSLSIIPNQYHDLFSSDTYYGPTVGWSNNYAGFCNNGTLMRNNPAQEKLGFDYWAYKVEYPENTTIAEFYNKKAGELFLLYCAIVPLYCNNAVKAYRFGDTGVINNLGGGVDNYYTFLNGNTTDNVWDYGFKSNIEILNQISSQWLWDQNCLGLQYESLMGTNPFNLATTEYWIASSSTVGTWDASGVGGDTNAAVINYTIRPNVYWHNATVKGRNLDVYDINFSFLFTYACGQGVAWNYPGIKSLYTVVADATTNTTAVKFLYADAWALLKAGGIPIVNRDIWGPLWNESDANWKTTVRNFKPDTVTLDDGHLAIEEDGTGAWVFASELVSGGVIQEVHLAANSYYYIDQATITARLGYMFHVGAGDVNSDLKVNAQDLGLMARAMFTNNNTGGVPGAWGAWNSICDLDGNNVVNGLDLGIVTRNYGSTTG